MKTLIIKGIILILTLILFGCNGSQENQTQEDQVHEKPNSEGFVEPGASEWVLFIKPVTEYMYYRTKAVVEGDIQILWDRYPDLKNNIDRQLGVNSEKYEVESMRGSFHKLHANFSEESYERIKVKIINEDEAIILVHGSIGYVLEDFDESGGEHLFKLFLKRQDNQWNVVKTDEYTLPEYKEWLKNK